MKKVKKEIVQPPTRLEGETYRNLQYGAFDELTRHWKEPYCFNGVVGVRKWRVILEPVVESDEIIAERITKLWRECDNHRHWGPLKAAANKVGLLLDMATMGVDKKVSK